MELIDVLIIAGITVTPTLIDLLFQYGIHRHTEKQIPSCKIVCPFAKEVKE